MARPRVGHGRAPREPDPSNVGVDHRHAVLVGETHDRARRVLADARQSPAASRRRLAQRRRGHARSRSRTHAAASPGADSRACPTRAARRRRLRRRLPTGWASGATQSIQIGSTRETGVCCSMNSLTRICHALTPGRRHGRSRCAQPGDSTGRAEPPGSMGMMAVMPNTSPAAAWKALKEGNERFVAGRPAHPSQSVDHRASLAAGQKPTAVVFGCADSRVAAEIIFDQGLGNMFVVRTAGHVVRFRGARFHRVRGHGAGRAADRRARS